MAAISNLSALVDRASGGSSGTPRILWTSIASARNGVSVATAQYVSSFTFDGSHRGAGTIPEAAAACDINTIGALNREIGNASGGRELRMLDAALLPGSASASAGFAIYDRLLHRGGLSGTSTGVQAVGGALARHTDGAGNRIFVEIYTAIGTTVATLTISYVDQDGNPATASRAIGGAAASANAAGRFLEVRLASGGTGVRSITSVQLSASTLTAGNFGVVIARPVLVVGALPSAGIVGRGTFLAGLPPVVIEADACLFLTAHSTTVGGFALTRALFYALFAEF